VFTGIIETVGRVVSLSDGVLLLDAPTPADPWKLGESVAVNGVCLTVVEHVDHLRFDLSEETLKRSSLGGLVAGSRVNLERAMRADGRFGGHIVQGHVDATGTVESITPHGNSTVFRFSFEEGHGKYLIDKGSISVDGISLTVVEPMWGAFSAWVIPHTLEMTNLRDRAVGDKVNLEFDMVAKYIDKLLQR
jgi:riboflavin synthase